MTTSQPDPAARNRVIDAARAAARSTIARFALDQGAEITSRPAFRGSDRTVKDVEPIAGVRAAYEIELATRGVSRDYIRYAREAGHTWHDIGLAMNLAPGRDTGAESIGEAAFSYAAGSSDTDSARRYGRSVAWTCKSCDQHISDHGLCNGPADDERGHADECRRLAATIARWDAAWEAER
jgi:hypothetical protein